MATGNPSIQQSLIEFNERTQKDILKLKRQVEKLALEDKKARLKFNLRHHQ